MSSWAQKCITVILQFGAEIFPKKITDKISFKPKATVFFGELIFTHDITVHIVFLYTNILRKENLSNVITFKL